MPKAPVELFPHLLGSAFDSLPEPVQRCHRIERSLRVSGRFTVTGGESFLARAMSRVMGMPPPAESVPTKLDVRRENDELVWKRDFDGFSLHSRMYLLGDGRMAERRGPFELCLRVSIARGGIEYRSEGARFCLGRLRVAVPSILAPSVEGRAWSEPGARQMHVRIRITSAIFGTIVTYEGPLDVT